MTTSYYVPQVLKVHQHIMLFTGLMEFYVICSRIKTFGLKMPYLLPSTQSTLYKTLQNIKKKKKNCLNEKLLVFKTKNKHKDIIVLVIDNGFQK